MPDLPNTHSIEFDELNSVLERLRSLKGEVSSANGTLSKEIKHTVDGYGWHKTALSMIRHLDDMPPVKRKAVLDDFDQMYELMRAKKWNDEQMDLFDIGVDHE